MKRTAVTQTAYYPVTLLPIHNFLCMCTMLILILPKIYEFYSTLTHRAGVVDKFVLFDSILPVLFTQFTAFFDKFCSITPLKIWKI